jgi:two-component system OmpR family sensor kinase
MSLRARLLLVLAVLATVGLVVANVITYTELRSFLVDRVDRSLAASTVALDRTIGRGGPASRAGIDQLAQTAPGTYVELRDENGTVLGGTSLVPPGQSAATPDLPAELPDDERRAMFTVEATDGSTEFRVRAEPQPFGTLVVAAPLDGVSETLDRLLVIEIVVTAAVVAAIVGLGLVLVRIGLRPLRRIEDTAAAIAGGQLDRRVEDENPRTEVGRLGLALNAMLARIEEAFAEKEASEARLRRFVADASHELRTPLASVRAYAELFERGAKDRPDDLARAMAGIERESRRMGLLVDDLLLLARLDQGRPIERLPVDLTELAGEAVDAARMLEPGRRLDLSASGPVTVVGDRERLRQLLDNLLANVRAHTPASAGADVRIEASTDRTVLLEVADDGPGLSEEQRAKVFERFYRVDSSRSRDAGGAGLGLAIVAAIAEAHGGDVEVESAPGRGASFRVRLPAVPPRATDGSHPAPTDRSAGSQIELVSFESVPDPDTRTGRS